MTTFLDLTARVLNGDHVGMNLIYCVGLVYLVVLVHECGHLMAAVCMGATPTEFNVGRVPRWTVRTVRGCSIVIGVLPGGKVRYTWNGNATIGRQAIVTAAGPAISGLVAVMAFAVFAYLSPSDLVLLYGYLSAADCVGNASPFAPDGLKLILLLRQAI